jgi:O-methyltransferase domain/Dimerisation domain
MQTQSTVQSAGPSLMPMITGAWASQAICVAATLGLADLLAQEHQSEEALAYATGTQPVALKRLLRALASLGVFRETEQGLFASTPLGDQLRSDVPGSLRNLAMMVGAPEARRAWSDLAYSVCTGNSAFQNIFGMDTYEYRTKHSEDWAVFNAAMADMTRQVAAAAIAAYDFSRFRSIVDAGGGNGALLASLLATTPGLNGILFELPSGTEGAPELLAAAGMSERCEIMHGNFFEVLPEGADAYILKSVMHNWNDETCCTILKNCAAAMSESSRLLVLEQVLPARTEAVPLHRRALMTDLNMLVMTGGCERGEAQYSQLLRASGLEIKAIVPTASSFSIIEASRAYHPQ